MQEASIAFQVVRVSSEVVIIGILYVQLLKKNNLLKFIAGTLEFHTLYSPECRLVLKQYCSR